MFMLVQSFYCDIPWLFPRYQMIASPWNHFWTCDPSPIPQSKCVDLDLRLSNHCQTEIHFQRSGILCLGTKATYNEIVSFQIGFSDALMVFVFFFTLSVSGINFNLTYGSLKPFGSMGIRLRPSFTVNENMGPLGGWIWSCWNVSRYLQWWVWCRHTILLSEFVHAARYDHNRISSEHFPRIAYERSCHMLLHQVI